MDGSGVPMLELFLRKDGGEGGELRRRLVAVRASPVEDASTLGQQLAESLQAMEGIDSSNAVLKVSSFPSENALSKYVQLAQWMAAQWARCRRTFSLIHDCAHLLSRNVGMDRSRLLPASTPP